MLVIAGKQEKDSFVDVLLVSPPWNLTNPFHQMSIVSVFTSIFTIKDYKVGLLHSINLCSEERQMKCTPIFQDPFNKNSQTRCSQMEPIEPPDRAGRGTLHGWPGCTAGVPWLQFWCIVTSSLRRNTSENVGRKMLEDLKQIFSNLRWQIKWFCFSLSHQKRYGSHKKRWPDSGWFFQLVLPRTRLTLALNQLNLQAHDVQKSTCEKRIYFLVWPQWLGEPQPKPCVDYPKPSPLNSELKLLGTLRSSIYINKRNVRSDQNMNDMVLICFNMSCEEHRKTLKWSGVPDCRDLGLFTLQVSLGILRSMLSSQVFERFQTIYKETDMYLKQISR